MKILHKIFSSKKIIFLFGAIVLASFSAKLVFAVWDGANYDPGETLNPECTPSQALCDVAAPLTSANISDTVYGAGWNGDTTHAPSKNAIYDKIEALNIIPTQITVADTTDTTSFVALFESATGDLGPKTDAGLTYNATTGMLTATGFSGPLTGNSSTATALQTARTIGGVSFDGTANITVASATGGFTVSGGNLNLGANNLIGTGTANRIGTATTADALADTLIATSATTQKGLVIQAKASQTANIFEIQNSAGTVVAYMNGTNGNINSSGTVTASTYLQGPYRNDLWGAIGYNSATSAQINSGSTIGWSSNAAWYNAANDTALSRISANVIGVGNGTAGDFSGTLKLANVNIVSGTVTTSAPALSLTQTWNGAGVDFTGAVLNYTATAAGTGSKYLDFQKSGSTRMSFRDGSNTGGSAITLTGSGTNVGLGLSYQDVASFAPYIYFDVYNVRGNLHSVGTWGWASGTDASATSDTAISRISAGVIGVGTGAQGSYAGTLTVANINGGTAANEDITIQGTTNSTRTTSYVNLQPSGGYVGIGATSPSNLLDIYSTADSSLLRVHGNSIATGGLYVYSGGANSGYISSGSEKVAGSWTARSTSAAMFGSEMSDSASFKVLSNTSLTSGNTFTPTEVFRISSTGNVGIGTTDPFGLLHLALPGTTTGAVQYVGNVTSGRYGSIGFNTTGLFLGTAAGTAVLQVNDSATTVSVGVNGNGKLNVTGGIYANASQTDTVFSGTVAADTANLYGSDGYWAIRTNTANAFNLDVYNSGAPLAALTVLQTGLVGIGDTTPTSHLQIDGNLSASAWTTDGIAFDVNAATYTDTSTAGAGTVATRTANSFGAPTFASTNAITVTDAFNLYVPKPIAGTNTTITRANSAYFEGNVVIGAGNLSFNNNGTAILDFGASYGSIYPVSANVLGIFATGTNTGFRIGNEQGGPTGSGGVALFGPLHADYLANMTITSGGTYADGQTAGNLHLRGGQNYAGGTNSNAGDVFVYGGLGSGSGSTGDVILAHTGSAAQGNVGIGTTSPATLLEVSKSTASGSFGTYPSFTISNPNTTGTSYSNLVLRSGTASGSGVSGAVGFIEALSTNNASQTLSIVSADEAYPLKLGSGTGIDMTILGSNVKIAGTATRATTEGTNHLDIFDGTAPVGTLANGISLYSTSGELRVMDAAGNATLLSPHENENNYWVFDSTNQETGKSLVIDMELIIKDLNDSFELDYVHETQDGELVERNFGGSLLSKIFGKIGTWLADATNGIANIFAKEINTETLCVADATGEKTCITKSQLDALLSGSASSSSSSVGSSSSGSSGSESGGGSTPEPQPEADQPSAEDPTPTPDPEPITADDGTPPEAVAPDPSPTPEPQPEADQPSAEEPEPEPSPEPSPEVTP